MPTAPEYRAAARRMRDASDEAGGVSSALWQIGNEHGVSGGQVAQMVNTAFVASALNADALRCELDALAQECDRRAELCDQFAAEAAAWRVAHRDWSVRHRIWELSRNETDLAPAPWPGPEPREPTSPFGWVEVS